MERYRVMSSGHLYPFLAINDDNFCDCFSRIIVIYPKIWPELARTCNLSAVQNQHLRVPINNVGPTSILQSKVIHYNFTSFSHEIQKPWNRRRQSPLLASGKGQLISKADLKVFIWTKNQRKYFCIFALAL